MDLFTGSLGLITILVTIFAIILMPTQAWRRASLVSCLVIMLVTVGGVMADLLSRPKPVDLEWFRGSEARANILSYRISIDRAIYLWLLLPGDEEPRYYIMPWNRSLALELDKASKEAKGQQELTMRLPFQKSWERDDKKRVYPAPIPMLPPKFGAPPTIVPRQEES